MVTKKYILDNSKRNLLEFGFFRTRLCKYLFNNIEFISECIEKTPLYMIELIFKNTKKK